MNILGLPIEVLDFIIFIGIFGHNELNSSVDCSLRQLPQGLNAGHCSVV